VSEVGVEGAHVRDEAARERGVARQPLDLVSEGVALRRPPPLLAREPADEPVGRVHALLRRLGVLSRDGARVRVRVRARVRARARARVGVGVRFDKYKYKCLLDALLGGHRLVEVDLHALEVRVRVGVRG
jgi:hypothetical protein